MYTAKTERYQDMKYNRCGKSGLKLPAVSFGLWHNFGDYDNLSNMKDLCFTAFDSGITHFDLANNYGPAYGSAEKNFGIILKQDLMRYRDEMVISTKAGYDMWEGPYGDWGSKKYLVASLNQSLKRMGLDYVDIFYHHRPDPETPLEETMLALDGIVKSGKALYAGISNYNREQTKAAKEILTELKTPFIINQVRYSMLDRWIEEDGLKEYAGENGIGLMAYSPLSQGLLTDKYIDQIPEDSRMKRDGRYLKEDRRTAKVVEQLRALNAIAQEREQSLAQMALSWVLRDPEMTTVLIGASRAEQIAENLKAIDKAEFDADTLSRIENILK